MSISRLTGDIELANKLLGEILYHACPQEELADGWKSVIIETHCVRWHLEVRYFGEHDDPYHFEVRHMQRS